MDADKLRDVLDKHAEWLRGKSGGERADLTGADLTRADLTRANLTYANLTYAVLADANLTRANLTYAVLTHAVLADANLTDAFLSGAVLTDAFLAGAVLRGAVLPRGYRIASLCFGVWPVTVTPETTTIGCVTHPNERWLRWQPGDAAIKAMDRAADEWWTRHHGAVKAVIRDVMQDGGAS